MRPLLLLLAPLLATPAHALSCAVGTQSTFPADGATGVPTIVQPRLWILGSPDASPILLDEADAPVPFQSEIVSDEGAGERVLALRPDAPLEAGSTYRLMSPLAPDVPVATFTTGEGPDETPPAPPMVLDVDRDGGVSTWGRSRWNAIWVDEPDEPVIYEVDIAHRADFEVFRTVQATAWRDEDGRVVDVGSGVCGGLVELERGERHVRVRAVDLAGHVSADASPERASGCTAAAAPVGGMAFGAALLVVGLRRRRGFVPLPR